ncbi:MAG: RND family transporter [Butyricicoccaceae bacterium]
MEQFFRGVIKHRKLLMALFLIAFCVCAFCQQFIRVNYDMNDYLPEDSASTVALDMMEQEFEGAIPNARVMIQDVSISEALKAKQALEEIDGVLSVMWLDDTLSLDAPLEIYDQDTVEAYYKDNNALFTVTIEEEKINSTVPKIRELIGDENAMTGSAVSMALATRSTVSEIQKIAVFAVLFVLFVLILTTGSWVEPFVVLAGIGVAVVINAGTNLIFGEISFVTNAAGNILQLAVSLDYSVFLIHRFEEYRKQKRARPKEAMVQALTMSASSILSSGLTTVIGFLALVLMRFQIGPDLGLALAKGIAISLITVFLFMPGVILMTFRWMDKTAHKSFLPSFRGLGRGIRRAMLPCACVLVLIAVPSYLCSTHNDYYYGSSHIFGEGTQYGSDTKLIEKTFGKTDTYVLMVPKGEEQTEKQLSEELQELDGVSSITSLANLIGPAIPRELMPEALMEQLESERYSRMVISVSADYEGEQTFALVERIRSTAQNYYPGTYYLAGEGVSTYDLMDTVTADMVKVNLVAIGAVFLVLLLTMRSPILSAVLVLTIESAIWMNLSIPYLLGKPLFYIAYLIISSIQLGATVDYAILFTERYQENHRIRPRKECVVETVCNVAPSILTSGSALTVVGFLLGKISTHGLLSQLGYLLGRGTLCSMACVMFVLPGFLYLLEPVIARRGRK